MINAYNLSYGDIVRYHGKYHYFIGLQKHRNTFGTERIEAIYDGPYMFYSLPNDPSVEEVELTQEVIESIAQKIEFLGDGAYKAYICNEVVLYVDYKGIDLSINLPCFEVAASPIHTLNELQVMLGACDLWQHAKVHMWKRLTKTDLPYYV